MSSHAPGASSAANLFGLDRGGLCDALGPLAVPAFHGGQIFRWLYRRGVRDPAAWTDLSLDLRRRLSDGFRVEPGSIAGRVAARDATVKYRVSLPRGGEVETVSMRFADRHTVCVSSQVGCALDCDFCLTGKMGFLRHLDPGEILGQIVLAREDRGLDDRPFHVVFMGMGEPLHNLDGVLAAFRILTDPDGFGLSRKRITVSTSGLVPGIERLARELRPPRLAVSLNATTDAVRDRLMPVNRKYPLARLLEACRLFARETGERFTFEYVLLDGVNCDDADVERLAGLVRGLPAKVNLIPFNAVEGLLDYRPPHADRVAELRDALLARGVPTSVRWSRGREARAACGQLALLPELSPEGDRP